MFTENRTLEERASGEHKTLSFNFKMSRSKHGEGTDPFIGITLSVGKGAFSI